MNELAEVQEDDERVFANDVEWHEPDGSGRNWDMHGYRGPRGYGTEIRLLVDRMRREYRLSEEAETRPAEYSSNPRWGACCRDEHDQEEQPTRVKP